MKIEHFISKSIQQLPLMYKDVNYTKSKLKVLNDIFFVYGNGLTFADTDIAEEGGYIVNPKYKDTVRIKDNPYGTQKYKLIPDDYFDSIIYQVIGLKQPIEIINSHDIIYYRYDKIIKEDLDFYKPKIREVICNHKFSPYPFSEKHSLICEVYYNDIFLQQDWLDEAILLCKETLKYFYNEELYNENVYYPTDKRIQSDLKTFEDTFKNEGEKGIMNLRKLWGYKKNNTCPTIDEITDRSTKVWNKFKNSQFLFLNKFLKKFESDFSSSNFKTNYIASIKPKEVYTLFQKASKDLFKMIFDDDIFNQLESIKMKEIDWNDIDIECSVIPNIKNRFKKEYFNTVNYSMLDLYIISVLNFGNQQKIDFDKNLKNFNTFTNYQTAAEKLFKLIFGDNMFEKLENIELKSFNWNGPDITSNDILKCLPNIKNRFSKIPIENSIEHDETPIYLFFMSVFHFGYQEKCN